MSLTRQFSKRSAPTLIFVNFDCVKTEIICCDQRTLSQKSEVTSISINDAAANMCSIRLCRHGTQSSRRQSCFAQARCSMLQTTGRLYQRYSIQQIYTE